MKPLVYLCGPIAGLTYDQARHGWRRNIARMLSPDVAVLSPMRQEGHLAELGDAALPTFAPNDRAIATQRAIVAKDLLDIRRCDLVLANFKGALTVSIGSVFELGYARAMRKPVVLVMDSPNPHEHLFIKECADVSTDSLEHAAHIIRSLLVPGV
ncbi:MAG: hypothetical protein D6746_11610 [Bacteroidetes bacterium]|nr:MAG: hypothetical protein D6746_11610 [Bacteroidota bacterium]